MSRFRARYTKNQRCGPHFSLIDPFVLPEHFPEAAALLRAALAAVPAFSMRLKDTAYFEHGKGKSFTLYVEPEIIPANALTRVIDAVLKVFPQCNDTVRRSGRFVPHISLAKVSSLQELHRVQALFEEKFADGCDVFVKELYLLSREGGEPFEVHHTISLAPPTRPPPNFPYPHFGPGTKPCFQPKGTVRSLVLTNLPPTVTSESLRTILVRDHQLDPEAVRVNINPDGGSRCLAVLEFPSLAKLKEAAALLDQAPPSWFGAMGPMARGMGSAGPIRARPLSLMVYPDTLDATCWLEPSG